MARAGSVSSSKSDQRRRRPASASALKKKRKKRTLSSKSCHGGKGIPPGLRKHAEILCVLSKSSPSVTKKLIASADRSLLKTLGECSLNVLKGVIPLTPLQKKRLRRYKTTIRLVSKKSTNHTRRRALLQRGGFVPLLLKTVLPFVLQALPPLVGFLGKKIAGKR